MHISGGGSYNKPLMATWTKQFKQGHRRRLNRFADMLSEGMSITAAAKELGLSQQAGSKMLRTIRDELGWQAR